MRSAPIFMVDMAHFAGLVAGGVHPNPLAHAHVVTTTTHKTLRGPRGGMILSRDDAISAKKINSRRLPRPAGRPADACDRRQGGRVRRSAEARIQDLREEPWSRTRKALAEALQAQGLDIVSGGTDTHLMLVDLRPKKAHGPRRRKGARPRLHHLQQERHSLRHRKAGDHFRHPAGHARRHHARLRPGRIPRDRQADRRSGRRGWPTRTTRPAMPPSKRSVRDRVGELCRRFPIYP